MAFKNRFVVRLSVRLLGFVFSVLLFVWLTQAGNLPTASTISVGAIIWAGAAIWSLTNRTNDEVARFVAALGQRDLTQNFSSTGRGTGFDELGRAFDDAMRRLRTAHADAAADNHFASALVDGAPTPLLTIDAAGRVNMANKAARKLFAGVDGIRIDDFAVFGSEFVEALLGASDGHRSTRLMIDGLPQRASLSTTLVERGGATWRIFAIQVIQHELDRAEIATQADLVRILTHEIMNSMTPVTSLAASAARLMSTIDIGNDPVIGDARVAVETLARRAEGTMRFVESYREFARQPTVVITAFDGREWLGELARLFSASPAGAKVDYEVAHPPGVFAVNADAGLLMQVTLNLLKNAAEAAADHNSMPKVWLTVDAIAEGRTRITVADNGPGIAAKYMNDVFLPFFTTKRDGTGVGLSFARQIILLHGGSIGVLPSHAGACIEMVV